jgi:integrase
VTAVTAALAPAGQGLMDDYLGHLRTSGLGERAVRDRVRIAREFLGRHPDLQAWMTLPVTGRVSELKRTGAWPLVCHAAGTGQVRLDLALIGAKHLAGLASAVETRDPPAFAAARAAGSRLGWKASWTETVLGECLAVLLAWHGGQVADLTAAIVDAFDTELAACTTIPPSSRRAYRNRLAGVRQLLFETRTIDTPPRRRPWACSLDQRFADVAMAPDIRRVLLRYVQARAAVLRPRSVESLVNDLLPFAGYLTARHPEVTTLRRLERGHIEGYLTWNRTRPWRGQRAAAGKGRAISAAVAQSSVLTLRNMLDDIAAWGWAEAPPRRLVFAADVPKLGQPLPRALPPDVDAAVMNAIATLDDTFARIGLTVLRGAGLRVGELLDLEIGSIISYGPAGTWLRVPLGKLATERMVPLDTPTLAALDEWAAQRGTHRPVPHPRTGTLTDFLFTARGRRLGATRLRNGLLAASQAAGLRGPGGDVLVITCHQLRHTWATSLESRDEPASTDGPARARHTPDDDPLRHPRVPGPADGLRRGHGQDAPPVHPHPGRQADHPRQGDLAEQRNAQNPGRARLLLTPRSRRRLPLRQHLRNLRQLHHRPRTPRRDPEPAHRHPQPASRRRNPRLGR